MFKKRLNLAWLAAAAALFIPRGISAMQNSSQDSAMAGASSDQSAKSGRTLSIGWQFRNGCELLSTRKCDGDRNRFEIRIESKTGSASVWSFETIGMDANHTIFNKNYVAPVISFQNPTINSQNLTTPAASANVQAGWQLHASAKMGGYDHYFDFGNCAVLKVGGSIGTIEGNGLVKARGGFDIAGGTYQIGSLTLPSQTINIPAFNILPETVSWPNINVNIDGHPIHISAGTWTSPSINFSGTSVKTPTIVTPPFQVTTPSIQKEWGDSLGGRHGNYFGEFRLAGALGKSVGSHGQLDFNPFVQANSRAVAGADLAMVVTTKPLAGNPPNVDSYLGRPFIPHKGLAFSFGVSLTQTVFDVPYYLEQRTAGSAARKINTELQQYAGLINDTAARAGEVIGIMPPVLHAPEITQNQIMGVLDAFGLPSPLGNQISAHAGFGGHVTKSLTYGVSAAVPLNPRGRDPLYSGYIGYEFH